MVAAMRTAHKESQLLERDALDELLDAIRRRGFRLVGPVLRDRAICYDDITSSADLPAGWTDEQGAAATAPPRTRTRAAARSTP